MFHDIRQDFDIIIQEFGNTWQGRCNTWQDFDNLDNNKHDLSAQCQF